MIELARTFEGLGPSEVDGPVQLKKGEKLFMGMSGAALVEPRRRQGHFEAGYTGFSFRLTKGVRYNVGGARGRYVSNPETLKAVDSGIAAITDKRVFFTGEKLAREWLFSKLLACTHDEKQPYTSLSVSNRQKVSGILYDRDSSAAVRFRLELALAHFNDTVSEFQSSLVKQLDELERNKPSPMSGAPSLPPST